jgi:thiol-disulfide isomerase/thioredoxin
MKYILYCCLFIFIACGDADTDSLLEDIKLPDLDGAMVSVMSTNTLATAFVFMAPDCPLCINYSKDIRDIEQEFSNNSFKLYLVFPGKVYSDEEISEFIKLHQLNSTALLDKKYKLVHLLKPDVTPEVVLVNKAGIIKYKGAFDDWMYGPGLRKQVITETYFKDAITAVLNGEQPKPDYVRAYGCYIEEL